MDTKVQETIVSVETGDLVKSLKRNIKRTTTGMIVGGCLGIFAALILKQPRMACALVGAAIGGVTGKLTS